MAANVQVQCMLQQGNSVCWQRALPLEAQWSQVEDITVVQMAYCSSELLASSHTFKLGVSSMAKADWSSCSSTAEPSGLSCLATSSGLCGPAEAAMTGPFLTAPAPRSMTHSCFGSCPAHGKHQVLPNQDLLGSPVQLLSLAP